MLFYSEAIGENGVILDANDSRHAVKALRLSVGDTIHVTDGHGRQMLCKISKADVRQTIAEIVESENIPRRERSLHVAIAPTKNVDRLETFVEKATEIGVERITPIICDHSERTVVKHDRLMRIVVSALKQSGQAWLPEVDPQIKFSDFLKTFSDLQGHASSQYQDSAKFIAHCEESQKTSATEAMKNVKDALILIGPEGDFSPAEIELAIASGFEPLSLGETRLRTETAAMVATTLFNFNA